MFIFHFAFCSCPSFVRSADGWMRRKTIFCNAFQHHILVSSVPAARNRTMFPGFLAPRTSDSMPTPSRLSVWIVLCVCTLPEKTIIRPKLVTLSAQRENKTHDFPETRRNYSWILSLFNDTHLDKSEITKSNSGTKARVCPCRLHVQWFFILRKQRRTVVTTKPGG